MDENRDMENTGSDAAAGVGGKIKKERLTRRISIDTIAKDLKMSPGYIRAIEENNFDSLPAYAYVRVYLRSIANYLQMDAEEIVHEFLKEMGEEPGEAEPAESVQDIKSSGNRYTGITIAITVVILLIIAGVVITQRTVVQDKGEYRGDSGVAGDSSLTQELQQEKDSMVHQDSGVQAGDSVEAEQTEEASEEDSAGNKKDPDSGDTLSGVQGSEKEESNSELALTVKTQTDSVWVHVFTDGSGRQLTFPPGNSRVFKAKDSINICVGRNQSVEYLLNGKSVDIKKNGPVVLRIDSNGVNRWSLQKFNRVFKGR